MLELEVVIEDDEEVEQVAEAVQDSEADAVDDGKVVAKPTEPASEVPGFTFDAKAAAKGFYGTQAVKVEPVLPTAPPAPAAKPQTIEPEVAEAPVEEPQDLEPVEEIEAAAEEQPQPVTSAAEGSLQSKLTDVRAKADEARIAKLRANAALYEGLGAAYDFALDAEDSPEEYLKLVEAKGLKIQLRSPMRPVVKLAFEGMCDESTIAQLESGAGLGDRSGASARHARAAHRGSRRDRADLERCGQGRGLSRASGLVAFRFAETEAFDHRVDGAFAGKLRKNVDVGNVGLGREPVRTAGDVAQLGYGLFRQLILLRTAGSRIPLRRAASRTRRRRILATPDDTAILVLETRDAKPHGGVDRHAGGAFDAAAVGRNIDHPDLDFLPAALAHRRRQAERGAAQRACGRFVHAVVSRNQACELLPHRFSSRMVNKWLAGRWGEINKS